MVSREPPLFVCEILFLIFQRFCFVPTRTSKTVSRSAVRWVALRGMKRLAGSLSPFPIAPSQCSRFALVSPHRKSGRGRPERQSQKMETSFHFHCSFPRRYSRTHDRAEHPQGGVPTPPFCSQSCPH